VSNALHCPECGCLSWYDLKTDAEPPHEATTFQCRDCKRWSPKADWEKSDPLTAAQARIAELEGRIERASEKLQAIAPELEELEEEQPGRPRTRVLNAAVRQALTILQEDPDAPKS